MKTIFILVICVSVLQQSFAQIDRQIIKFNFGWEMFTIDSMQDIKNVVNIRNSTAAVVGL